MSHHTHDDKPHPHHEVDELAFAVITISTSRNLQSDPTGDALAAMIEDNGDVVAERLLVTDDKTAIRTAVMDCLETDTVDVIVTTGGTGLAPSDVTVQALEPLFDRHIPGFGELFRVRSYHDIGPHAMLSRALAGTIGEVAIFCLPGSESGATFGLEELVLPAGGHVIAQLRGL